MLIKILFINNTSLIQATYVECLILHYTSITTQRQPKSMQYISAMAQKSTTEK